jgi:hypothetical protein
VENHEFDNNGDQFVLSYELLQLMEWLVEKDEEGLKKLIKKAISNGLDIRLKKEKNNKLIASQAQDNIVNFLTLLEIMLTEATQEHSVDHIMEKALIPAIDQVDITACDTSTLKSSIAVATSKSEKNPNQNAQDLFLKELLKRWKPSKKKRVVN